MSKEYLEALNYVWYNYYTEELSQDEVKEIEKNLNIVQDGLKRLEAIDNSNSSEALECLEEIGKTLMFVNANTLESKPLKEVMPYYYETVTQALIKAQEQEKVIEIIFKKNVNIVMLKVSENVESYNITYFDKPKWQLTEEEFDLLKRYFK